MPRWEREEASLRADLAGIGFPIGQTVEEVKILRKYAKLKPKGTVSIEIGTRNGGSALILAMNSFDPVITIDMLEDPRVFDYGYKEIPKLRKHWARYPGGSRIEQVTVKSWEYQHDGRPVGLVFIDGSHEYEDVAKDFYLFLSLLIDGGYLLMHDYETFPGVTQFLNSLDVPYMDRAGSIVVYKKWMK